MKKLFMNFLLLVISTNASAQFHDSFNRTYFDPWQGDTAKFLLTNGQLQSNSAIVNDNFYIARQTTGSIKEWRLETSLKFNTSSTNYIDFYLYANKQKLELADTALYLKIGNTKDEISLYQTVNGITKLLFDGKDGVTNSSSNYLNFVIQRVSDSLTIKVVTDELNPTIFEFYTAAIDTNLYGNVVANMGWVIKQSTASFFGKHFFDNCYAGEIIKDTTAPKVAGFRVWNDNVLSIYFDEKMDTLLLKNNTNYVLSPQNMNPINVISNSTDSAMLVFSTPFISGANHTLTIDSLRDSSGNVRLKQSFTFFYKKILSPVFKDLLISEIYSKPIAGYLGVEAIEVYNNSDFYINLKNCKLADLTNSYTLPNVILEPKKYYVFCDDQDTGYFSGLNVVAMPTLPSLNDDGDLLRITNAVGAEIYSVYYYKSWHELGKQEGGWSLELKNVNEACPYSSHYQSCTLAKGHSLGLANGKFANIAKTPLSIVGTYVSSPNTLQITWNKPVNFEVLRDKALYNVNPFLAIDSIVISPAKPFASVVYFKTALQELTYQMDIGNFITCDAQTFYSNTIAFGLPKIPTAGALKLAEVMFNSKTLSSEFIEIDNANQYTALKGLFLVTENDGKISSENVSAEGDMLAPNQKLVLAKDLVALGQWHPLCESTKYIQLKNWATLNDDQGKIWLTDLKGAMIDSMAYNKTMHSKFIADDDGVSIEKVDTSQASWRLQAWASSPSTSGYATPGCTNHLLNSEKNKQFFSLASPYFSENEIGKEQGVIQYQMPLANYSVNIFITDRFGRLVKQLANNEIIPASGNFLWDGSNTAGQRVVQGIYFIKITAVHANGDKQSTILELTKL